MFALLIGEEEVIEGMFNYILELIRRRSLSMFTQLASDRQCYNKSIQTLARFAYIPMLMLFALF